MGVRRTAAVVHPKGSRSPCDRRGARRERPGPCSWDGGSKSAVSKRNVAAHDVTTVTGNRYCRPFVGDWRGGLPMPSWRAHPYRSGSSGRIVLARRCNRRRYHMLDPSIPCALPCAAGAPLIVYALYRHPVVLAFDDLRSAPKTDL